jgi:hypothetical protein
MRVLDEKHKSHNIKTAASAPYAASAIPIFLMSTTGLKYRTLNCIECGRAFMERQADTLYRIGDDSRPEEINLAGDMVSATCGNCRQEYSLHVEISVTFDRDGIPLYLQPQSLYITNAPEKTMRYLHCLECGKSFHTISDRISMISDNRVPFEYLPVTAIGPMEAICRSSNCSQLWSLMI